MAHFFLPVTKTVNYLTSLLGEKKRKSFEKWLLSEWSISELVSKQRVLITSQVSHAAKKILSIAGAISWSSKN